MRTCLDCGYSGKKFVSGGCPACGSLRVSIPESTQAVAAGVIGYFVGLFVLFNLDELERFLSHYFRHFFTVVVVSAAFFYC